MSGYIVVGVSKSNKDKVAGHASEIGLVVRVDRYGSTQESGFNPGPKTPGQDLLKQVDQYHPEAEAIITGDMKGPPGYKNRALINDSGSIAAIAKKYREGGYDSQIKSENRITQDQKPGDPQYTGEGGGGREQMGRGGCPPEEQQEYGKGSGTKTGGLRQQRERNVLEYLVTLISQPYITSLVKKYQSAKTPEEKTRYYNSIIATLRSEARKEGLEGEEVEEYIKSGLEEQIKKESRDPEEGEASEEGEEAEAGESEEGESDEASEGESSEGEEGSDN